METNSKQSIKSSAICDMATAWLDCSQLSADSKKLLHEFSSVLSITHSEALVLAVIYTFFIDCESTNDKHLHDKIKGIIHLKTLNEILLNLEQAGMIYVERGSRRRGNDLSPSQGIIGFIKTSNPNYLKICQEPGGDGLLNICLSWHIMASEPFSFSKPHPQVVHALIDYHEHPVVTRIRALSSDITEQAAALYLLGYEALYAGPMSISKVIHELVHDPLPRMKLLSAWSSPNAEVYRRGLFQITSTVEDQVSEIQLNPTFSDWAIPKDLRNSSYLKGSKNQFVELIDPRKIGKVQLRYPVDFQIEIDLFFENLQTKKFNSYVDDLRARGLPPNFSAMLYGAPGTGKTELVRQLARKYKRTLMMVNLSGLRDKYFGESEKNITRLFREIRAISSKMKRAPIVLFNEADGFFHERAAHGRGIDQTETAIVALFLNELETFTGIVFATSNHTSSMDKAFERRWTLKLEVPAPDEHIRARIMFDKFKGLVPYRAIQQLAAKYAFSPAQVDNILKKYLLLKPLEERVEVLEQLIIHEVGGWSTEVHRIGFK